MSLSDYNPAQNGAGERRHIFFLPAEAGIKAAQDLANGLREALAAHDDIGIDTGNLTGADITTVQTLLAARATAEAMDKSIHMVTPVAEPLHLVLAAAGFLTSAQRHAGFWEDNSEPAGSADA